MDDEWFKIVVGGAVASLLSGMVAWFFHRLFLDRSASLGSGPRESSSPIQIGGALTTTALLADQLERTRAEAELIEADWQRMRNDEKSRLGCGGTLLFVGAFFFALLIGVLVEVPDWENMFPSVIAWACIGTLGVGVGCVMVFLRPSRKRKQLLQAKRERLYQLQAKLDSHLGA